MEIKVEQADKATPVEVKSIDHLAEASQIVAHEMLDYLDEAISVLKEDKYFNPLILKLREVETYIKTNIGG